MSVSKRTIDNLIRQRRLSFIKVPSKIVRFPKAEADAYLAPNLPVTACELETDEND